MIEFRYYNSPIAKFLVFGKEGIVSGISSKTKPEPNWELNSRGFSNCISQLDEYFNGRRKKFDFKYLLSGTAFQQQVLKQVAKINYGNTRSFSYIATQIDNPKAVRAVGTANARNILPIVIPCHRVIGKSGKLTGYALGLKAKEYLLNLEK